MLRAVFCGHRHRHQKWQRHLLQKLRHITDLGTVVTHLGIIVTEAHAPEVTEVHASAEAGREVGLR